MRKPMRSAGDGTTDDAEGPGEGCSAQCAGAGLDDLKIAEVEFGLGLHLGLLNAVFRCP